MGLVHKCSRFHNLAEWGGKWGYMMKKVGFNPDSMIVIEYFLVFRAKNDPNSKTPGGGHSIV